jgi:simple sugar transport system permease protein
MNWRGMAETLTITLAALVSSLVLFGAFMLAFAHVSLSDLYYYMYLGAFGSKTAWQDTLTRAAPLILTALCTALPARLGLIVIGGEGALVLGGLAAVGTALAMPLAPAIVVLPCMMLAGMLVGGFFIASVGVLRDRRGVNETISSLLMAYIAIDVFSYLVEGPMRDPASLNKPSTYPIPPAAVLGNMGAVFGDIFNSVHWGFAFGIVFCIFGFVLMRYTTFGFAVRMVGGNVRAAQGAGLPVGKLIFITCFLGGAAAGLAGAVEVSAVQTQANAALMAAGYGFAGILVSFIARHNPLAIIPAAILFGGLNAASGILQRRMEVPDASVKVLMGILFVTILLFETLYGRFKLFQINTAAGAAATPPPPPAPPHVIAEPVTV